MNDRIPLLVGVLGTEVAVLAPGAVATQLRSILADLESSGPPTRRLVLEESTDGRFRLLDEGALVRAGVEPVVAAATIVWRLNTIAAATEQHLLVHAGVVGGVGAAILPGRSGAGKSTLVAACVAEGMAYLSDEYAAVDLDRGTVVPYPKPIGLEGERLVASADLGSGSVPRAPVATAGIVFPRYEEGRRTSSTTRGRRLDVARAGRAHDEPDHARRARAALARGPRGEPASLAGHLRRDRGCGCRGAGGGGRGRRAVAARR